jgi:hypothetical protein
MWGLLSFEEPEDIALSEGLFPLVSGIVFHQGSGLLTFCEVPKAEVPELAETASAPVNSPSTDSMGPSEGGPAQLK